MDMKKQFKLTKKTAIVLVILLILIGYLVLHKKSNKQLVIKPPVVVVKKPQVVKMAEYVTQTGNTVAFNSVDLVARVEGYLTKILFTDGTFVKKDSPLFVIEPEPYLEKLKEAQATVEAQKADLAYSKAEYARQQRMYKENATSLNSVEKWRAKMDESEANQAQAVANERIAEINYGYTHINAPFDGRMGRHLVDVDNLVGHAQATKLATIEQIKPIYVYFNLNELDLIKIRAAARASGFNPKDINKIPVDVGMQDETGYPHKGYLDFVNTGLNASTGTIKFRAILVNKDYLFLPGQFVQVRIAISQPKPELTVPDTAVQYDQIGAYLLLVDKNKKVVLQRVTTGGLEQGRRAIVKGLKAQDQVIVDGLQNATPGNPVTPQSQA